MTAPIYLKLFVYISFALYPLLSKLCWTLPTLPKGNSRARRYLFIVLAVPSALLVVYLNIKASVGPPIVQESASLISRTQNSLKSVMKRPHVTEKNSTLKLDPVKTGEENQAPVTATHQMPVASIGDTQSPKVFNLTTSLLPRRPPIPREGPEIRQVIYAKVHKAASTTMQNIFMRFALARDLNVLLHVNKTSISESGSYFSRYEVVPLPRGKQFYDILCSHVIFNEHHLARFFPKTAARVAMVREPLSQALSALRYYLGSYPTGALLQGFEKYKEDTINGFFRNPSHFYDYDRLRGPTSSHINNRMSIDLGFDLNAFELSKKNQTKIQSFLRQLEEQFDVVLVSEFFDESLVLMRRMLRWPTKDIIYLKANVGKSDDDPMWDKTLIVNSTLVKQYREWAAIDYQLYDHFTDVFMKMIQREPRFQEELTAFKTIQMDVKYFCLHDKTSEILHIPRSDWTNEFSVSRADCRLMLLNERQISDFAKDRQFRRYQASKR
ncbi:hypothetical protein EGW08_008746 [Elysia chlorotica]|uniref:Galactose-3-O-sulfotransferase 3 n=1 Tax=Elysia chlorotica TaxID=188477 RepID=A0A433TPS4_ELYCH|nr:hypothetical protein EGW08_008746 [Elysia chlorotica]